MNRSPDPKRRPVWGVLGGVLLSAATVLLMLGAAEVVTRTWFPVENMGRVIRFDPIVGWSLRPRSHLHSVDHTRGFNYHIRIDENGFRAVAGARRTSAAPRVLFVGDSVTFGDGVEARIRFSDFVARAMPGVDVINAGVPGWGTDQEFLFLENRIGALHPDVVVLSMTLLNDVINNRLDHLFLGTAPKPRFVLDDDGLRLSPTALVPSVVVTPRDRIRRVARNSHFLVMCKRRLDRARRAHEAPVARQLPEGFDRSLRGDAVSQWSVFEKNEAPGMATAWTVTESLLVRCRDLCAASGANLLVVDFPLIEADDAWRGRLLASYGLDPSEFDFAMPHDRLLRFCASSSIDCMYPIDEFREAVARGRELYYFHDGHPNMAGHALAARVLLPALRERTGMDYSVPPADAAVFAQFQ